MIVTIDFRVGKQVPASVRSFFVCTRRGCTRMQPYAPAHEDGGVTVAEARALGWTIGEYADTVRCPFHRPRARLGGR